MTVRNKFWPIKKHTSLVFMQKPPFLKKVYCHTSLTSSDIRGFGRGGRARGGLGRAGNIFLQAKKYWEEINFSGFPRNFSANTSLISGFLYSGHHIYVPILIAMSRWWSMYVILPTVMAPSILTWRISRRPFLASPKLFSLGVGASNANRYKQKRLTCM